MYFKSQVTIHNLNAERKENEKINLCFSDVG